MEKAIDSGYLATKDILPPEREIAALTGLSRVTVRKAVEALVAGGKIIQQRGSGSYVAPKTPRMEQSLFRLTSFTEEMANRGMSVESQWLERGLFMPTEIEKQVLGLTTGASVARVARLRFADGTPLAIERASLSTKFLPNPLIDDKSLYDILGQDGHCPVRATQRISATNLDSFDAGLLEVDTGIASLKIERTSFLQDGQVVEFTQSIYRGNVYDFVAELQLSN